MEIQKFLYSKVLLKEMKNNKLSNSFALISISLTNLSKSEGINVTKINKVVRRISQELKVIEGRYYQNKLKKEDLKKHITLYIKLTNRLITRVKQLESKKTLLIVSNLNKILNSLTKINNIIS